MITTTSDHHFKGKIVCNIIEILWYSWFLCLVIDVPLIEVKCISNLFSVVEKGRANKLLNYKYFCLQLNLSFGSGWPQTLKARNTRGFV